MTDVSMARCWPNEFGQTLARHRDVDVIVGLFSGPRGVRGGRGAALLGEVLGVDVVELAAADPDFDGGPSARSTAMVSGPSGPLRVVIVGLAHRVGSPHELFDAALATNPGRAIVSTLSLEADDALGAVAQGHAIGAWRYRRDPNAPAKQVPVELVDDFAIDASSILARARVVAAVTRWVRQLVEMPPNTMRPSAPPSRLASSGSVAPRKRSAKSKNCCCFRCCIKISPIGDIKVFILEQKFIQVNTNWFEFSNLAATNEPYYRHCLSPSVYLLY